MNEQTEPQFQEMLGNLFSRLGRGLNFTIERLSSFYDSAAANGVTPSTEMSERFRLHRAYLAVIDNLALTFGRGPVDDALQAAAHRLGEIEASANALIAYRGDSSSSLDAIVERFFEHYDGFLEAIIRFHEATGISIAFIPQQQARAQFYKRLIRQVAQMVRARAERS